MPAAAVVGVGRGNDGPQGACLIRDHKLAMVGLEVQ